MAKAGKKKAPKRQAAPEGDVPSLFSGVETLPKARSAALRVVYATDQGFVKPTLVSMMSLLEKASTDVDIFVIGHNLSSAAVATLKRVEEVHRNAAVSHLAISEDALSMASWSPAFSRFSPIILSRLYIPSIFEAGRVLYLDSDTFVRADVSELFDIDMDGKLIAAVKDGHAINVGLNNAEEPRVSEVEEIMGDHPATEYFNSAMIVFDCRAIAESGFGSKLLDKLKGDTEYKYPDQDIMNEVFRGNAKLIGREWNSSHHFMDIPPRFEHKILHYPGSQKPWETLPAKWLEHQDFVDTRGAVALEYRFQANRLLEGILGDEADVMKDLAL